MADELIIEVASLVKNKLASLPHSTAHPSIYKIPRHLFEVSEKAYLPSVVSIGPIHSQQPYLQPQATQELKSGILQCFLQATSDRCSLEDYIRFLRDNEEKARSYYAETVRLSKIDFTLMLLIDGVFVINYLMRSHEEVRRLCPGKYLMERRAEIYNMVKQDILLEDNQLPLFVLQRIYDMAFGTILTNIPFTDVTSAFVSNRLWIGFDSIKERVKKKSDIKHLVDFMWICIKPSTPREKAEYSRLCSSVSNLHAAGVKFEATESKNMLDITFNEGVLRIPKIILQDSTESIFRSILAFEQCYRYFDSHFADYMIFVDSLINTPSDVDILVRSGIIDNCLGSDYAVADFFNNIAKNVVIDLCNFYYCGITNRLNAHASARPNRWKAILKRDYFSHPWAIISVIYAVILLLLTVAQTVGTFTH